jgi:hypothetical protein
LCASEFRIFLDFKDIAIIYNQMFDINEDELLSDKHSSNLSDILESALWEEFLALVKELDSKVKINWDEWYFI